MSALLCELKVFFVITVIVAVTATVAKSRQVENAPIYLPAIDPYMFNRVCVSACPPPEEQAETPALETCAIQSRD